MVRKGWVLVGWLVLATCVQADVATEEATLRALVERFLAGASRSDPIVHESFWDDELIYTSSSGKRFGKAEILRDVAASRDAPVAEPATVYTAEEMRIHLYGASAVVAFRLVGTSVEGGRTKVDRFLNTGTFVKRPDGWRAVAWQATRIPAEEPATAPAAQFHRSPHPPHAGFPFSEAVRAGEFLFLSGQVGNVAGERKVVPGGIREETRQAMENVRAVAGRHGATMADLVRCTVFLADLADWAAFNEVYRSYFTGSFPARSALAASGLALGARVEVECTAYLPAD